jgi:hypothetical protein
MAAMHARQRAAQAIGIERIACQSSGPDCIPEFRIFDATASRMTRRHGATSSPRPVSSRFERIVQRAHCTIVLLAGGGMSYARGCYNRSARAAARVAASSAR